MAIFALVIMVFIPCASAYVPPEGIYGYVRDEITNEPIAGATVVDITEGHSTTTNANGYWALPATVACHSVRAYRASWPTYNAEIISITCSSRTGFGTGNHYLNLVIPGIWGYVKDSNGNPVANLIVRDATDSIINDITDSNGFYHLIPWPMDWTSGYKYVNVEAGTGYFDVQYWRVSYSTGQYSRQDFTLENEFDMYQDIFDAYITTTHFRTTLTYTETNTKTDTIGGYFGVAVGGFSFQITGSSTTTTTLSSIKTQTSEEKTSFCVQRKAHIDGALGYNSNLGSNSVRSMSSTFLSQSYDRIDSYRTDYKHLTDPGVQISENPNFKSGKYLYIGFEQGMGNVVTLSSVTISWTYTAGYAASFELVGIPVTIKAGGSYGYSSGSTTTISFTLTNTDQYHTHGFAYWFEGGDANHGGILHIWEYP